MSAHIHFSNNDVKSGILPLEDGSPAHQFIREAGISFCRQLLYCCYTIRKSSIFAPAMAVQRILPGE